MSDLISRQDIEWHEILVREGNGMYHNEKIAYKSQIDDLPPAQPKTGKWVPERIQCTYGGSYKVYRCDQCGVAQLAESNYCPVCGVYMRGEPNE